MEMMLHAYIPSFISMRGTVSKFEEWRKSSWRFLWSSWKRCNTHVHQVSPPCMLQLASLRSEEVNLKKSTWGYLLLFTIMYFVICDIGYWIHCVYKRSFIYIDKGQAMYEGRADFRKEGIMYDTVWCSWGCGSLVKMWRIINDRTWGSLGL